jgi:hypothetical protein
MDHFTYEAPTIRLGDIADRYRDKASAELPLRCRTLLNLVDGRIMRGHTEHVGEHHLTVTVPSPLTGDQECAIFFAIAIAEHTFTIVGTGYVIRCSGNDMEGYRVDLRFLVEDKKSRMAMEQLFSTSRSRRIQ